MSNARKGPSGPDMTVVTIDVAADVTTLSPARIHDIDVLRLRPTTAGEKTISGLAAGRDGQQIRILVAPEDALGGITLLSESGATPAGTQWFFDVTIENAIAPTNFNATYDATSGKWWITSIVND